MLAHSNTQYIIRGFFAFMLFIGHYFLILGFYGVNFSVTAHQNIIFYNTCRVCITGFFVSSGFYIAVNLAKVKNKVKDTGFFFVKTFWIKRIFRFWPTYFVIILLALFLFPHINILALPPKHLSEFTSVFANKLKIIYYLLLLPQIPHCQKYTLDFADLAWSMGVEEIFYIFIPFVFFYTKQYLRVTILLFVFYFVTKTIFCTIYGAHLSHFAYNMFNISEYENILLGCIVGILVNKHPLFYKNITKQMVLFALFCAIVLLIYHTKVPYTYLHIGLCFALIFAYYFDKEAWVAKIKPFVWFGKMSLSFYAFHQVAIAVCINVFKNYINIKENAIAFIGIILPVAIAISYIAYKIIEEPFLNRKNALNYTTK